MMREKYESLALSALKEVAKARGLKGISTLKKEQLVERMLEEDKKEAEAKQESENKKETAADRTEKVSETRTAARPEYRRTESTRTEAGKTDGVRTENTRGEEGRTDSRPRMEAEDSGVVANGILEVMADGYGFIRSENFLPGENDIYVAPSQIRRFNLKTGDIVKGNVRVKTQNEKFGALLFVGSVNGLAPDVNAKRPNFEDMTPIFSKRAHSPGKTGWNHCHANHGSGQPHRKGPARYDRVTAESR